MLTACQEHKKLLSSADKLFSKSLDSNQFLKEHFWEKLILKKVRFCGILHIIRTTHEISYDVQGLSDVAEIKVIPCLSTCM